MSDCCCCCSFLTLSGSLGYYLYYQDISNIFNEIDKFLISKNNKIELEPLKSIEINTCNEPVVSHPPKNEFVLL